MTGFMLYQKLNGKWRDDKMSDKYQNTELIPEERAAYLLEELSLDEKVAQLNCVFPFDKASYDFAGINEQTKHGIGQVSTLEMRRMESLDEVVRWQRKGDDGTTLIEDSYCTRSYVREIILRYCQNRTFFRTKFNIKDGNLF